MSNAQLLSQVVAGGTTPGDTSGPASATNNNVAVFDGATGKLLKDGGATLAAKQDVLVSGTNIKTINGSSLLGSGNLTSGDATKTKTISDKTGAYTVVAGDNDTIINCTANSFTVALTAAATLGSGFNCWIWNTSATSTHAITIDPNASETIDGLTTRILRRGEGLQIVCNGANWQIGAKKAMRAYAENMDPAATASTASGDYAFAIGSNARATGASSVALGLGPVASGVSATAIGESVTAATTYSSAIGNTSGGSGSQTAAGAGAMALGGSYASGTDSFAAAIANNTSSYGVTGANSMAMGYQAKATGTNCVVMGRSASATANYGIAIGESATNTGDSAISIGVGNTTSAANSVAIGTQCTASGSYSTTLGYRSSSTVYGKYAYASGRFASNGDAQTGKMVLRGTTTNATPGPLTTDNAGTGTVNNQVILPNDSTYAFTILVVARRTDADNESAGYEFKGVVDRNGSAATTAIVGSVSKTVLAEDTAAWDCNVTADTTNGGLSITVTGEAAKTIRWVAVATTAEVTG